MSDALIQIRGPGVLRKSAKVAPLNRLSSSHRDKTRTSLTPPPRAFTRFTGPMVVESPSSALRIRNFSRKSESAARFFKPKYAAATEPPDTPDTKVTLSSSECVPVRVRTVVSLTSWRTPYEKAAARVPPPEKASPTMTSSPALGSWRLAAMAPKALPLSGWLVGSRVANDEQPATHTAIAVAGATRRKSLQTPIKTRPRRP